MPHRDHETRLRDLQTLCAQADQLRAAADELCRSLEDQLTRQMDGSLPPADRKRSRKANRTTLRRRRR